MAAASLVRRVRVSTFGCLMARGHAEEKPAFACLLPSVFLSVKQARRVNNGGEPENNTKFEYSVEGAVSLSLSLSLPKTTVASRLCP